MENINDYLLLIIILISFFLIILICVKYFYKQNSKFSPINSRIPNVETQNYNIDLKTEPNVYQTEDTRMQFSALPPVNPIVRKRNIIDSIPVNQDLFTPYFDTEFSILDTPPTLNTNELNNNTLIDIPLQMNYPNDNEQLRSQKILITDYNKIKYGNCKN